MPACAVVRATLADLSALAENEPARFSDLLADPGKIAQLSSEGRGRAVRVQEILSTAVAECWPLSVARFD